MAQDAIVPAKKLIVIGGSAGSLDVLLQVVPNVNQSIDTAIVIVLHRLSEGDTLLTTVFASRSKWNVREAEDKDNLVPGYIYIAPGGYHLLIEKRGTLALDCSEKINYSRPSIDPTFETAAEAYGSQLKCLLLSGANADGVSGIEIAMQLGARVAAQDPNEAIAPYMPAKAIEAIPGISVLDTKGIVRFLSD